MWVSEFNLESAFTGDAMLNTNTYLKALMWAHGLSIDSADAVKIVKKQRHKCIYSDISARKETIVKNHGCKCDICGFDYKPLLHIHHILPIKMFGDNRDRNIACLCPNCHKIMHKTYELTKKDSTMGFTKLLSWINKNYGEKAYKRYCDMLDTFSELRFELLEGFAEEDKNVYSN